MQVGNYNAAFCVLYKYTERVSNLSLCDLRVWEERVVRKGFLEEGDYKLSPYLFHLIFIPQKLISQSIRCLKLCGAEYLDQYRRVQIKIKKEQRECIVSLFLFPRQIIFSYQMSICKILCLESTPFLPTTAPFTTDMFIHDDDGPVLSSCKALTIRRVRYQNPVTWNV